MSQEIRNAVSILKEAEQNVNELKARVRTLEKLHIKEVKRANNLATAFTGAQNSILELTDELVKAKMYNEMLATELSQIKDWVSGEKEEIVLAPEQVQDITEKLQSVLAYL